MSENKAVKQTNVFIIGAKCIGQYGGYETFLDKLTEQHASEPSIQYYIVTKANGSGAMDESKLDGVERIKKDENGVVRTFRYHNARRRLDAARAYYAIIPSLLLLHQYEPHPQPVYLWKRNVVGDEMVVLAGVHRQFSIKHHPRKTAWHYRCVDCNDYHNFLL